MNDFEIRFIFHGLLCKKNYSCPLKICKILSLDNGNAFVLIHTFVFHHHFLWYRVTDVSCEGRRFTLYRVFQKRTFWNEEIFAKRFICSKSLNQLLEVFDVSSQKAFATSCTECTFALVNVGLVFILCQYVDLTLVLHLSIDKMIFPCLELSRLLFRFA